MSNMELSTLSSGDLEKLLKQIEKEQKTRQARSPQKLRVDAVGIPETVSAIKAAARQHGVRTIDVIDAALRAMKLGFDITPRKKGQPDSTEEQEGADAQASRRRGRKAKAAQ